MARKPAIGTEFNPYLSGRFSVFANDQGRGSPSYLTFVQSLCTCCTAPVLIMLPRTPSSRKGALDYAKRFITKHEAHSDVLGYDPECEDCNFVKDEQSELD